MRQISISHAKHTIFLSKIWQMCKMIKAALKSTLRTILSLTFDPGPSWTVRKNKLLGQRKGPIVWC